NTPLVDQLVPDTSSIVTATRESASEGPPTRRLRCRTRRARRFVISRRRTEAVTDRRGGGRFARAQRVAGARSRRRALDFPPVPDAPLRRRPCGRRRAAPWARAATARR